MAIQNRRGSYTNFDPQKLKPGEWAIVQSNDPASTDGKTVYIAFSAGDVKRMATFEDMESFVYNIVEEIAQELVTEIETGVADDVTRAETAATTATTKASEANASAQSAQESAEIASRLYRVSDPNNDGNLIMYLGNGGS